MVQSNSAALAVSQKQATYLIWRIVGNELPPRHQRNAQIEAIQFILQHEETFPDSKRAWLLNRIADRAQQEAITQLLEAYGEHYEQIPFDAAEYLHHSRRYDKILYSMNNNGARNYCIEAGRQFANYILPLDGMVFIPSRCWSKITAVVQAYEQQGKDRCYFALPMVRVAYNEEALHEEKEWHNLDEPQLIFRSDASLRFDETYRYGYRSKVELLCRLGRQPGFLRDGSAPEFLHHEYSENEATCPTAGIVFRLSSGNNDADFNVGRCRAVIREASIDQFFTELDTRLGRKDTWYHRTPHQLAIDSKLERLRHAEPLLFRAHEALKRVPSDLSEEEGAFLFSAPVVTPGDGAIVKLGRRYSRSMGYLCAGAACSARPGKVFGIDPPDAAYDGTRRPPRPRPGSFPTTAHLLDAFVPIVQHVECVAEHWQLPIRVLVLDGSRAYEEVMANFRRWARYVVPQGIILFGAISQNEIRLGCEKFVHDRIINHPGLSFLAHVGTYFAVVKERAVR